MTKDEIQSREQDKLSKFKINYYYLATGMEGIADTYPEKIIEAKTKDMAVYIYLLMFMAETDTKIIEVDKSNGSNGYSFTSFSEFVEVNECHKYWGVSVDKLTN